MEYPIPRPDERPENVTWFQTILKVVSEQTVNTPKQLIHSVPISLGSLITDTVLSPYLDSDHLFALAKGIRFNEHIHRWLCWNTSGPPNVPEPTYALIPADWLCNDLFTVVQSFLALREAEEEYQANIATRTNVQPNSVNLRLLISARTNHCLHLILHPHRRRLLGQAPIGITLSITEQMLYVPDEVLEEDSFYGDWEYLTMEPHLRTSPREGEYRPSFEELMTKVGDFECHDYVHWTPFCSKVRTCCAAYICS